LAKAARWVETGENPAILAFLSQPPAETLLAIHNLSGRRQVVDLPVTAGSRFEDVFSGQVYTSEAALHLEIEPYAYLWLKEI